MLSPSVAKNAVKRDVEHFVEEYKDYYLKYFVKYLKMQARPPAKLDEHLLSGPESKDDIMAGWMMVAEEPGKKWVKCWCIMRFDYTVQCFADKPADGETIPYGAKPAADDEEGEKKEETKGPKLVFEIFPYKMKLRNSENGDKFVAPKKAQEGCAVLCHKRRLGYYFFAESADEMKEWMRLLKIAKKEAPAPINHDYVARNAFYYAYRYTRWWAGIWDNWEMEAPEREMFGWLVFDCVIHELASQLPGGGIMKKIAEKTIKKAVTATCAPAWTAMMGAVKTIRSTMEPTIQGGIDKMCELEDELKGKLDSACMDKIREWADEHIAPHLAKCVDTFRAPVVDGYRLFVGEWETRTKAMVDKVVAGGEFKKEMKDLEYQFRWPWWDGLDKPVRKLEEMYKPLKEIEEWVTHIWPWWFVRSCYRRMMRLADRGFFTIKQRIEEATRDGSAPSSHLADVVAQTLADLKHDVSINVVDWFEKKLFKIWWYPIDKTLMEILRKLVEPLASAVPGPIDKFLNINDILEDYVKAFLRGLCTSAVEISAGSSLAVFE